MQRPPFRIRSILIGLAGLAALFAGLEAVTRLFLVSPSAPRRYTDYGWIEAPGTRVVHSDEGYSRTRLNSYGLDDDEPDSGARFRALLLGDSYGQSRQVSRREGFSRVAEEALPGLDVVNASRSGFSPLADAPGAIGTMAKLARHSALATFMARRLTMLAHREKTRLAGKLAPAPASAAGEEVREGEGTDAPVPESVAALLDGIYAHVKAREPRVVFVYIPNLVYGSTGCRNKWPIRRAFFQAFAERTGATLVDTTEPLCAEFARTGQPMHGFDNSRIGTGHLNARGHAVVGRVMAEAIGEALR